MLDELGYLPFSQAGGALPFHLISKLYERTSGVGFRSFILRDSRSTTRTPGGLLSAIGVYTSRYATVRRKH